MEKIRSVIIDDEEFNRSLIKGFVKTLNDEFEVIGEAENVKNGYELIKRTKPQVVFLDIKMPDGSGFNLLELFSSFDFEVVFVSGFDSYALKAFEFNALDFVVKPIDPEKFSKTLVKVALRILQKTSQSDQLKSILQSYDTSRLVITKIPVHIGGKVILLNPDEIVSIESEEGCTVFKTISNEKYLSSKQFSDFDFILENHAFLVRIHRSIYINVNYISSYSKGINCIVYLKNGSEFEISRRKKAEVLEILQRNGAN